MDISFNPITLPSYRYKAVLKLYFLKAHIRYEKRVEYQNIPLSNTEANSDQIRGKPAFYRYRYSYLNASIQGLLRFIVKFEYLSTSTSDESAII